MIEEAKIRVNQVGFMCRAPKEFILTENPENEISFAVELLKDVVYTDVFCGTLSVREAEGQTPVWVGDFSALTEAGDYRIRVGREHSRHFVVYDRAYEMTERVLLGYFTYQRCGSPLGWAGTCHTDDGYIKETGEHVDLRGGYHQSCDLRKSPAGVSIGVLGMMRCAMEDESEWGKILYADEIRWACDYYAKTVQENGATYNTINDPLGWGGKVYYRSAAPSSAQWCATSILALGARYFQGKDDALSAKYREKALASYGYMTGNERQNGVYKHPEPEQVGYESDYAYRICYKDSASDLGYGTMASYDLYTLTGDAFYRENALRYADRYCDLMLDGDFADRLFQDAKKDKIAYAWSYSWVHGFYMPPLTAYELTKEEKYKKKAVACADALMKQAKTDVYGNLRYVYCREELNDTDKFTNKKQKDLIGRQVCLADDGVNALYYDGSQTSFSPTATLAKSIFLTQCGTLFDRADYLAEGQRVVNILLGGNAQDSCAVVGIGVNHIARGVYGQFFPSTPDIPGAVTIGYQKLTPSATSEYDMPCVGEALYALSTLRKAYTKKA